MAPISNPAIPLGSLILVTGATGYIASHIVDQFLLAGYGVRGTVREAKKAAWLQEYFDSKYGKGKFDTSVVLDMNEPGAFDEAVKGPYLNNLPLQSTVRFARACTHLDQEYPV